MPIQRWRMLLCLPDSGPTAAQDHLHTLRHVLEQVKAVSDLARLGRSVPSGRCVVLAPIAA